VIVMLIWLAGAAAMAYEITTHGMWRDGVAALSVLAFILWVLGGAAGMSAWRKVGQHKKSKGVPNV
jgi:hypothetical protein